MSGRGQGPVVEYFVKGKLLDLVTDHLFLEKLFHGNIYD
jgi:hypothetical protein